MKIYNKEDLRKEKIFFNEIFEDSTRFCKKINQIEYLNEGEIPIIDQGKNEIAGYSNLKENIYNDIPAIIFGDHTRIIKYIDFPFLIGADGVKVLKNKRKDFLDKYLYYALKYFKIPNTGYNRHFKWLKEFSIYSLKIEEQNKIVRVLDNIQEIIKIKKEQLLQLNELSKSIFIEMFGDPIKNEKKWKKEKLDKYITIINGYAFESKKFLSSGIPVLRIANINTGIFKPINIVYWKKDEKLKKYIVYPEDLVITLTGTVGKDDYGNICILDKSYDCYYLNQRNAKLELKNFINKYYLSFLLKIPVIKKKLTNINRGVRQANISNKDILNLDILIPPIELQNQFAEKIKIIEKSKVEIGAVS